MKKVKYSTTIFTTIGSGKAEENVAELEPISIMSLLVTLFERLHHVGLSHQNRLIPEVYVAVVKHDVCPILTKWAFIASATE